MFLFKDVGSHLQGELFQHGHHPPPSGVSPVCPWKLGPNESIQ